MNELELFLQNASLSDIGVRITKAEQEGLALVTPKNANDIIPAENLTKAKNLKEEIGTLNKALADKNKAREDAAVLQAGFIQDSNNSKQLMNTLQTASYQNPADRTTFAMPKTIGTLTSFRDTKTVTMSNGRAAQLTPEMRALHLGYFLLGSLSQNPDVRSKYAQLTRENGYEILAMSEGNMNQGGYLVPPQFSSDFIYLQELFGIGRTLARKIAVDSNTYRENRRQAAVTAYWETELNTITKTAMGIDQVEGILHRISALIDISNELSADSIINLMDWLIRDSSIQMGFKEDDAFFNGDGSAKYGNTLGIIPGLQKIASNKGVVTYATGTAWTAITKADIESLMGALPMFPGMNPKLFCSNNFYRTVLRTLMVNAGGNTILTIGEGAAKFQFDGTEVVISQALPKTDPGTGTISLLYGDPMYSSWFLSKGELSVFTANQGDTNMAANSSTVRIDERVAFVNHELGSSTLAGAMVGLQAN